MKEKVMDAMQKFSESHVCSGTDIADCRNLNRNW